MEILLIKYGYVLLFLGVLVEGEAFLLAASFLANRGAMILPLIIAVAIIANCTASQAYYMVARTRGRAWLEKRFGRNPHYKNAVNWMSRHADWVLLFSRFAFGFRIIIPAACGALDMPVLRFSLINIIAGTIWAIPVAMLGFYLGHAAKSLLSGMQHYQIWAPAILLAMGLFILLIRHLRRTEWIEDLKTVDLHTLAPLLIGFMGAINIFSAILPRSHQSIQSIASWLPLEVAQGSKPLMLLSGIALLQITRNLARRKELAWYVAVIALLISFVTHIAHAFDLHHSAVSGLLLAYLWINRRRFYARSDPGFLRLSLVMLPVLGFSVLIYGYVGLSHRAEQYEWHGRSTPWTEAVQSGILIRESKTVPRTKSAARFLVSIPIAGWLARLYLMALILRPVILRKRQEASEGAIQRIFQMHGKRSLSAYAVQSDKHHLLLSNGDALVAFAVRGSIALAAGDPLSSQGGFEKSVHEYLEYCSRNDWAPCFYSASEEFLPVYYSLGLRSLKIAEEAILDLQDFGLSGNKRANLRAMVNKAAKSGMAIRFYDRGQHSDPLVDQQLEEISQEWLNEKSISELGFSLGRFSLERLNHIPVFLGVTEERIDAFCSWLPYRAGQAAVLDIMRKRKDVVAGTMDFLIYQSLIRLKEMGCLEASLANAPLANIAGPRRPLERGVALLFENMNAFYGYKNLFQFKKKFAPYWESRYLVYPKGADLPRVASALAGVHSSGSLLQLLSYSRTGG
jgi:phosphatidylglycerol lysyltransferase